MPFLGPEGREQLRQLGRVGTIGLEIALSVAVGVFAGRWLDARFDTGPWLERVGLFFGLAAAARSFYRVAQETRRAMASGGEREDDAESETSAPPPTQGPPTDDDANDSERRTPSEHEKSS